MGLGDFLLAGMAAVYAMVGGAVLNAAITSPVNTKRLLDRLWREITTQFICFGLIPGAGVLLFVDKPILAGTPGANALAWIATVQTAFYLLARASRSICRIVLEGDDKGNPSR